MTRVGFIGLGSQGAPMARRIVEEGFPLTVWARRSGSVEPFGDTAATVASTPAELGAASDIVGLCVVADADVEDVLLRSDGVLAGMMPGGIVAIHSTIHPDTCRRLAETAADRGVAVVDAPVSGGGYAAAARKLLVMVGGADDDVARCRPVFETFADPVIHLGPLGSGQVAKLLNNLVFTAQLAVALDAFSFADRLGVDRASLAEVLANGSGGSRAAATLAATDFDTSGLGRALPLLRKDVALMLDVARSAGASEPAALVELAHTTFVQLGDVSSTATGSPHGGSPSTPEQGSTPKLPSSWSTKAESPSGSSSVSRSRSTNSTRRSRF
jgi:3-hydroxyisobutyrate dehydrogenase-like beta-hydroxyacid dehydrogenase